MASSQEMKIHFVRDIRSLRFPDRLGETGFAHEFTACESVVFGRPKERFHTSNPIHVTCKDCLRMIDEGQVELTLKTRAEYRAAAVLTRADDALREERAIARDYLRIVA